MSASRFITIRQITLAVFLTVLVTAPAAAQTLPERLEIANLSGPRFGMTVLPATMVGGLRTRGVAVKPVITQFGWQVERQLYTRDSGVTMVTEWVMLLGGLEQGFALPSVSWLAGIRGRNGFEFGLGPNISPAGFAMVFAAGTTFRTRAFNVPVNVAVVPSRAGTRVSIMTGFSLRTR